MVRPTRWESAAQRIETAMAHWEQELGRALVRPVVLEGDIAEPGLGLSDSRFATGWRPIAARSCTRPRRSRFMPTRQTASRGAAISRALRYMLELCRRAGIRQCHHVSTAYVCGRRRGRILETELDVGQEPGNDYERSKLTAEKEVLRPTSSTASRLSAFDHRRRLADRLHDFVSTDFIRRCGWCTRCCKRSPGEAMLDGDWLGGIELAAHERKNLVPVEWVSAAMARLVTARALPRPRRIT